MRKAKHPRRDFKFTGHLYQLVASQPLHIGAPVGVNGPWDTYGVVQAVTPHESGGHLHLIRGVKPSRDFQPIHEF